VQIHQNDIRLQRRGFSDDLISSGRLAHDLRLRDRIEQHPYAFAEEEMVISNEHADRFHRSLLYISHKEA